MENFAFGDQIIYEFLDGTWLHNYKLLAQQIKRCCQFPMLGVDNLLWVQLPLPFSPVVGQMVSPELPRLIGEESLGRVAIRVAVLDAIVQHVGDVGIHSLLTYQHIYQSRWGFHIVSFYSL